MVDIKLISYNVKFLGYEALLMSLNDFNTFFLFIVPNAVIPHPLAHFADAAWLSLALVATLLRLKVERRLLM